MSEKLIEYFKGDELAASVWKGKYAQEGDVTPDDMHRRMAREFARVDAKYVGQEFDNLGPIGLHDNNLRLLKNTLSTYGYNRTPLNEGSIYELFKDFKYVIPQGSIMAQLGAKSIGSLSNCFVVGQPFDSYGGIMQKDQELVQLMKRRGGVGLDLSTLRPEGTDTSNAAKSSTGAISFMHRFSNSTREVAQNGRRGALMLSIDINHPDVMEFIKIKRDLSQVTGANISIKLNDEFMKAVEKDEDYLLTFPCKIEPLEDYYELMQDLNYGELTPVIDKYNGEFYVKKIRAKEYWEETIKSAHNVAEPGLMFWDRMVEYSPDGAYKQFRQVTTNPCSEIGMQPYDACRLIAVNLFGFIKKPYSKDAEFDFDMFYKYNYEAMRLSDNLIDLEMEHIERIITKIKADPEPEEIKDVELKLWEKVYNTAKASRRTGLGFTALGDTLAALGLKYDSDEALQVIEQIMKAKMLSELDCSIDLAILRGTFEGWDKDTEFKNEPTMQGPKMTYGQNDYYKFVLREFPDQAKRMYKHGRRNVSMSTVAPTGTVSLLAQTTSGVEPIFLPFYIRRKKVNASDKNVRVDFTDQNGDTWQEYAVLHPKFKDWLLLSWDEGCISRMTKNDLEVYFKLSPWYGSTANDIDWIKRVEIQAVIQKYISHSISSTINLPENVSEAEVSKIYFESWKRGIKGITVYREGSRSGVMISNSKKDENSFDYHDAPKRPKILESEVHNVTALGEKFTVIIGLFDGKPYEVFVVDNHLKNGRAKVEKITKGQYTVDGELLQLGISDEEVALTRMISTALRHGADIKYVVEQLNKADGTIVSFSKAIARTLKKYVPDGTKSTLTCTDCGGTNVIFEEGCSKCTDCGSSKCG